MVENDVFLLTVHNGLISYEMGCLVDFGANNMEAILAATKNAAIVCQMEDKVGTPEKGKFADFIAVRENPLIDIRYLRNVEQVYKEGKQVQIIK